MEEEGKTIRGGREIKAGCCWVEEKEEEGVKRCWSVHVHIRVFLETDTCIQNNFYTFSLCFNFFWAIPFASSLGEIYRPYCISGPSVIHGGFCRTLFQSV